MFTADAPLKSTPVVADDLKAAAPSMMPAGESSDEEKE